MFYQEALSKFWFVFCVDSLLTIGDRHWQKLASMFRIHFHLHGNGCPLMWGAYFCMGACKSDVVANGCLYSWGVFCVCFYGISYEPMAV